jgi:hypothetical protein
LKNHFRFHGYAIGAAGRIDKPSPEVLEVQAAAALPLIGGRASGRSTDFNHKGIIKFASAYSEVTGADCKEDDCEGPPTSHATHLRCVIEGLDIMSTVTADRVVANLVSTAAANSDNDPSVRILGTRFENLKIAGIPVDVKLGTHLLDKYDTHAALEAAYLSNKTDDEKAVRALIDRPDLKEMLAGAEEHFRHHFHFFESKGALPASKRGTTYVSLVQSLEPAHSGLNKIGHVVHVPGFGTIRLGEVHISRKTRLISMVQANLDCPHKGVVMAAEVSDGGVGSPPDWF